MFHKLLDLGANPNLINSGIFVEILNDLNCTHIKLILDNLINPLPLNVLNLCLEHMICSVRFHQKCFELFMSHDIYNELLPISIFEEKEFHHMNLDMDTIDFLLRSSKISIEKHGVALLNVAVERCNIELFDFLMNNNIDINTVNPLSIHTALFKYDTYDCGILIKLFDNGLILSETDIAIIIGHKMNIINVLMEHNIDAIAILIKN